MPTPFASALALGALHLARLFGPPVAADAPAPAPADAYVSIAVAGREGARVPTGLRVGSLRTERLWRTWRMAPGARERLGLRPEHREAFAFRLTDGDATGTVRCTTGRAKRREHVACWIRTPGAERAAAFDALTWRGGYLRGSAGAGAAAIAFGGVPDGIRPPAGLPVAPYYVTRGVDVLAAVSLENDGAVYLAPGLDAATADMVSALATVFFVHADLRAIRG